MNYAQVNTNTLTQYIVEFLRDLLHILWPYSETIQVGYKDWPLKFPTLQGWRRILQRSQGHNLINISAMLKNACNIALVSVNENRFLCECKLFAQVDEPISEGVQAFSVSRKTCDFVTEFHVFLSFLLKSFIAYMRLTVNRNIICRVIL